MAKSRKQGMASIGTRQGAANAGLEILASEIEDHPENQTRFVLVGYGVPAPTGHDKTSIVCFQRQDRPGSLLAILQEFAARVDQHHQARVAPDQARPRRLLLLHRLRGPPRRRARRRLPAQPRGEAGEGEVPRLVPGRRATTATCAATRSRRRGATPNAWLDGLREQIRARGVIARDRPQAAARRTRVPRGHRAQARARRSARRGARGRRRAGARCSSASRSSGRGRTRRRRRSARRRPTNGRRRSRPRARSRRSSSASRTSSPASTPSCARSRCRCPTRPTRRCPTAARTTARCCASSATRPPPPPLDHAAFGEAMGWVESEQAVEMSGSRFAYLMREAVLLELALVQWVTSKLVGEGFTPVVPPVLVREEAMEQAGFFPTDRNQVYEVDERRAVPRRHERGAAVGHPPRRDPPRRRPAPPLPRHLLVLPARGGHVRQGHPRHLPGRTSSTRSRCSRTPTPRPSWDEHEALLAIEESIVGGLGLPYRVVNIAAGDLGAAAAKKYDVEVWLPSEGAYRELTSCSNYLDFSARRLATRVKGDERQPARAHAQRHRVRDRPHAGVPVRALPGRRRRLHRARGAAPLHRLRPRRTLADSTRGCATSSTAG